MLSPLFHGFGEKTKAFRVAYAPTVDISDALNPLEEIKTFSTAGPLQGKPGNRLKIIEQDATFDDCQAISSVEEAEDLLMNIPPIVELTFAETSDTNFIGYEMWHPLSLPLHINRAANLIAARTRRGPGQVCLMNSVTYDRLVASDRVEEVAEETVGRWTKKALVNKSVFVYVGDFIPDNEVFVAYVGSGQAIDGPGDVLEKDGALGLYLLKNTVEALGNVTDYVQRFRVTITNS